VRVAAVGNGLDAVSGDAYQQTLASGQVNLDAAGTNGTGTITPSALEQSNVDLSTQLTNLIVAQQAYGANQSADHRRPVVAAAGSDHPVNPAHPPFR
jgi:flagellar hook-basal body protein